MMWNRSSKAAFLALSLGLGFLSKMFIPITATPDRSYYISQMEAFLSVGYFPIPDSPIPLFVLALVNNFVRDGYASLLLSMALASTLVACPVYGILRHRGFYAVSVGILVATFRDYIYVMMGYGIWRNILGILVYSVFLFFLYRYDENRKPIDLYAMLVLFAVQFLTHELAFSIQFVTFALWVILSGRWRLLIRPIPVALALTAIALSLALSSNLHYPLLFRPENFDFNFARFYEAWNWLPVTGQMLVFVGVFAKSRSPFERSVALSGLILHVMSWVMVDGRRMLYLTQIPLAVSLPVLAIHPSVKEDRWMTSFLAVAFIAPYIGRFIFNIKGGW